MIRLPPRSTRPDPHLPYTTLFRSLRTKAVGGVAPTYDPAPASAARRGINRRLLLLRRILHRTLNRLRPVDRCLDRIAQLCIGLRFGRLVRGRQRWPVARRSEEHTSELQSLMRITYDVFC